MPKVIRNMIADYLNTAAEGPTETWSLMGAGFTSLDENPSAKVDSTAYISDASASGTITGYENTFAFDTQFISDEAAIKKIYEIARNQKVGSDAECDYLRVDLWDTPTTETKYPARKFRVAVEVTGITGAGTEVVRVAGNLHQVGDFVPGKFDISTKTFTPDSEEST